MNNIPLAKQLAEICSLLHEGDNLSEEDYWISEIGDTPARGFAQSALKGRKGHAVTNQNGDLLSRPTNRVRTGFWTGEVSHISGMKFTSNGSGSDESFVKHVRSFGYTYRHHKTYERLDYIPEGKGMYSMIILPNGRNAVEISLDILYILSWPSGKVGEKYTVKEGKEEITVSSGISETVLTFPREVSYTTTRNSFGIRIELRVDADSEITISGDCSKVAGEDLENTIKYHSSVKEHSILHTPDFRLNKLFLWAKHDLLELYTETGAGSGFYAGLPGFSWFFGRDGEWISQAATEVGMANLSRQHLDLFWKYSRDGRIPHELPLVSESDSYGFEIDGSLVSTRFLSIDSSPLWIINSIHYSNWTESPYELERIEKVSEFIRKCDGDSDGFLENNFSEGLIGWVEEWARVRDGKCVDVNAHWIQAQKMYEQIRGKEDGSWKSRLDAYLTTFVEENNDSTVIYDSINDGRKNSIKTPMSLIPLLYFSQDMRNLGPRIIKEFSGDDMMVPWGIRSLSDEDPMYNDGYHTGMVWPLMTGWSALAAFSAGDLDLGMKLLGSFITLAFSSPDPGRLGEAYSSADMREAGQFFQGWSSSLFIISVVEGLFGMTLDAMRKTNWQEYIWPKMPDYWNGMGLLRLKKGNYYYNIECTSGKVRVEKS